MQDKEVKRLNGVYNRLLESNGVDLYGEPHLPLSIVFVTRALLNLSQ